MIIYVLNKKGQPINKSIDLGEHHILLCATGGLVIKSTDDGMVEIHDECKKLEAVQN